MRVRLGEHNLRKHDGPEQVRSVSRIIPHPGYEARTHRHDIMLLRLLHPARLSSQVHPVALPTRCPFTGEDCVVSGWGLLSANKPGDSESHKSQGAWKDGAGSRNSSNTALQGPWVEGTGTNGSEYTQSHLSSSVRLPDTLHCANISIISEASCNKDYPGRVLPTMVCAGVEGRGTDSCEETRNKKIIVTPNTVGAAPPIQSRIIGGSDCEKSSQPWQAAIYHYTKFQCGGILVDPKWVLTAAHCYSDKYQVWLGRNSLDENEPSAQHLFVHKSFPHPDFNMDLLKNNSQNLEADYSNDLMLLQLTQPAEITDSVKVLSLPTEEPTMGSTCLASGWGSVEPIDFEYPENLQCVNLKLLPIEECIKAHAQKVTDLMLCAGDLEEGKDTCVGDSGGPLICDGMFQGVTSWGPAPCGKPDKPGIYTKLIEFVPWINEVIKKHS
ncbi:kallikrein 1 [Cricetulus griseus]